MDGPPPSPGPPPPPSAPTAPLVPITAVTVSATPPGRLPFQLSHPEATAEAADAFQRPLSLAGRPETAAVDSELWSSVEGGDRK